MRKVTVLMLMGLCFGLLSVLGVQAQSASGGYKVVHVATNDRLNLRSSAGVEGKVIGSIPHNAANVQSTGEEQRIGRSRWLKVKHGGHVGWVNRYYLQAVVQASKPKATPVKPKVEMNCFGTEPYWTIKVTDSNMVVKMMDGPSYDIPVEFRQKSANNTSIAVIAGRRGNALTSAVFQKVNSCSDGMSDNSYPYSITAMLNAHKVVSGCCSVTNTK